MLLFYAYAGDPPPGINEAHYWVKAKQFWDPSWLAQDAFAPSGKAHWTFYVTFGALTQWFSLPTAVWIGRWIGWGLLAAGLQRVAWSVAPIRYGSLLLGLVWMAGIEYGDLAGEWVVGGIEAKVPAYAAVLFALSEAVRGRWSRVWPLLGVASAFHVLVGGWSVLAAGLAWGLQRGTEPLPKQLAGLVLGGLFALFGLLPGLALSLDSTPQEAALAAKIYTYQRLRHHLLPAAFAPHWYLRHGLLAAGTLAVLWPLRRRAVLRPIIGFTAGAWVLVLIGLLLGLLTRWAPDLAAQGLRYYWFRLTDAAVPLALGLGLLGWLTQPPSGLSRPLARRLVLTVGLVAGGLIGAAIWRRLDQRVPPACDLRLLAGAENLDKSQREAIFEAWTAACRWARDNTPEEAVFLTPRHQQTFKWYAHRAEVVNWKDVPQDAPSLLAWRRRFERVFPRRLGRVRVTIQYRLLREFRRDYGAEYLLVDRRIVTGEVPLRKIYPTRWSPNAFYAIYRLPLAEAVADPPVRGAAAIPGPSPVTSPVTVR